MFAGNEEQLRTLESAWRLVARHRWLLVLTTSLVVLGTAVVSYFLPNQYVSEATVIVEQQQVPERYVTPTSTADLSSALQAMEQEVLSRTQLLKIIDEVGLYPKKRARWTPDELVEYMRSNIEITPLEGGDPERREVNSFRISFTGDSAAAAQQVTTRLTNLFIDENLKSREQQAVGTTNFLGGQLEAAQSELEKQEERLKDFKLQNLGELPEQQQGNLAILSGLQSQLQGTTAAVARAQEQRAYLTSLLTQYRELAAVGAVATPGTPTASPIDSVQAELARLRDEKAQLLARDLPQHPDVVKVDEEISQANALLDQLTKAQAAATTTENDAPAASQAAAGTRADAVTAQTKSQLEANQLELKNLGEEQKRLEAEIQVYQQRLNLTPVREQQLTSVLSDYNEAKQNYQDLMNKKTQSELAANLEQQQQGQQFRIVDPPSLPLKPTSPNRIKIGAGGAAGGLGLAVAIALLIEFKKACFYTETEIKQRLQAPLVLGIPILRTPGEIRRRAGWRVLEWAAGTLLVMIALSAEVFVCWRG